MKYFEQPMASCNSLSSSRRKIRFDFRETQSRVSVPVDIGLDWHFEESIGSVPSMNNISPPEEDFTDHVLQPPRNSMPGERHMQVDLDLILEELGNCSNSTQSDTETLLSRESPLPISPTIQPESRIAWPIKKTRPAEYRQSELLDRMENDPVFLSITNDLPMEVEPLPEARMVTDSMLYEPIPNREYDYKTINDYNNSTGVTGLLSHGIHNTFSAASFVYTSFKTFAFW
jgi:hypothetical protein